MNQEKTKKFYPGEVKNILITGGAGFIGSHLCDRLIKEGNVICLDNFIGGDVNNIKHLLQKPNFRFIKHDINQRFDLENFHEIKDFRVDIHGIQEIYHLACPTSARNFNQLKMQTLQTNSIGTINILELTKFYKAKLLFTSSSVVYGPKKASGSFKENESGVVNFIGPRACYDEGKRFSETAIITYRDLYGLEAKIVRVFRTYGPREVLFDGQMVPDFVLQALSNKPLVIYGDESFSTSLCYISDLIEGLIKVMESKENGPINLGHSQEYKLFDLAQKIIDLTGSQSKIEFLQALLFMTPLGMPDISLAKEKLGWYPIVRIEDGLKELIDYVKANWMLLKPLVNRYE
jgi:UDP-glucuronate decarboxylase